MRPDDTAPEPAASEADRSGLPPPEPTPYQLIGGDAGVRRLAHRFYDIMDLDPALSPLRAMHADNLRPMRETLAAFLIGWLGGPPRYAGCMRSAHAGLAIGPAVADQWMDCMRRAMADTGVDPALRPILDAAFLRMATMLRAP